MDTQAQKATPISRPISYLPDPDKWIDTSSSAKPKRTLQRPLASFRNSFATPPATLRKNNNAQAGPSASALASATTSSKKWVKENEPRRQLQSTLSGLFTPPMTSSAPRKTKRSGGAISRLREGTGADTGSPRGRSITHETKTKMVRKHANDSWRSHGDFPELPDEPGPSASRMLKPKKASGKTSSSSPDIIDLSNSDEEVPPRAISLPPNNSNPTPPIPAPIPSSNLPPPHSSSPLIRSSTPAASDPPSDRTLTPIPDAVLNIHARLCGQDSERMKRVKSPWRKVDVDVPRSPVPAQALTSRIEKITKAVEKRIEIDERAEEVAVQKAKARLVKGKGKLLVDLSSSDHEEDPQERGPLMALRPNALAKRPSGVQASPVARKKVKKAAVQPEPLIRSPMPRTPIAKRLKSRSRSRSASAPYQPISLMNRIYNGPDLAAARVPSPSPVLDLPIISSPTDRITTPRKPKSPHHQISPPKSRTPSKRIQDIQETLFAFPPPAPPPQPIFEDVKLKYEWKPVEMEPETLLTWSLGGPMERSISSESSRGFPQPLGDEGLSFGPAFYVPEKAIIPSTPPSQRTPNAKPPSIAPKSASQISTARRPMLRVRQSSSPSPSKGVPARLLVPETAAVSLRPHQPELPAIEGEAESLGGGIVPETMFLPGPEEIAEEEDAPTSDTESMPPSELSQQFPSLMRTPRKGQRPPSSDPFSISPSTASQAFPELLVSPSKPPRRVKFAPTPNLASSVQSTDAFKEKNVIVPETVSTTSLPKSAGSDDSVLQFTKGHEVIPETVFDQNTNTPMQSASATRRNKRQPRTSDSGWKALDHGILSSLPASASPHPAPPPDPILLGSSAAKRSTPRPRPKKRGRANEASQPIAKRTRSTQTESERRDNQPKLAAFGFFGDQKEKRKGGEFERAWSDEVDVPEHQVEAETTPARKQDAQGRHLARVPDAPWHPDLRPAGIAEFKRRAAKSSNIHTNARTRSPSPSPPNLRPALQASGISSSLTSLSTEATVELDDDARAWFEGMEDRRLSDIGVSWGSG